WVAGFRQLGVSRRRSRGLMRQRQRSCFLPSRSFGRIAATFACVVIATPWGSGLAGAEPLFRAACTAYPTGMPSVAVIARDVNEDGRLDLVTANQWQNSPLLPDSGP